MNDPLIATCRRTGTEDRSRVVRRAAAALALLLGALAAASARAQQTLFNVPSADVLAAGSTYIEGDLLWRSGRPDDTYLTVRGVTGLGAGVEGGVNLGGFVAEGRSVPAAVVALKCQPYHAGQWSITAGVHGLFYLRGAVDGTPSGHAYTHAAWSPSGRVRVTAGAWYATSGFAAAGVTRGALAGLELHLSPTLVAQADWYSGKNGLGTFTPGIAWTLGRWVVYAGYSLKNGDSHGNGALIELGRNL